MSEQIQSKSPKSFVPAQTPKPKEDITYEVEKVKKEIRKRQNWQLILPDPELKKSLIDDLRAGGASLEGVLLAIKELEQFETNETSFNVADVVSNYCIFHIDGLIPHPLRNSLEQHLSALAKEQTSGEKVQDLIDPSLFPYIDGTTLTYDEINHKTSKKVKQDPLEGILKDRWGRLVETSEYQWLPANYFVNEQNKVKITSYINNVDRNEHPELYTDCELIFEKLLPVIEMCMEKAKSTYKKGYKAAPALPKGPRTYQVITKASTYQLRPGETYEGIWHIEGMTHEYIMASALFYYSSSSNIKDIGLSFRVGDDTAGPTNLGTVRTPEGRCIVFSNEYQHKVAGLTNDSTTTPAVRKILAFFVIDPASPIVSSLEVPPQQWDRMKKKVTIRLLLVLKRLKVFLPKDIIKAIVNFSKIGFTMQEALEHKQKLLKERMYFINEMNEEIERDYSTATGTDDGSD